jgi:tetratricopeptide (TPR) repeat protein
MGVEPAGTTPPVLVADNTETKLNAAIEKKQQPCNLRHNRGDTGEVPFSPNTASGDRSMSIVDGMPSSLAELQERLEFAVPIVRKVIDAMDLPPEAKAIMEQVQKGRPLADIYGLTQEERDAMFVRGCQLLQAGEVEKARDWFIFLHQLDPLDERLIYAIATIHQTQGDFSYAAKLYVHFIAFDATNPEGHLRLAECFLSAREYDLAIEHFQIAKTMCDRGYGNAAAAELAVRMLAHANERRAAHGLARLAHH